MINNLETYQKLGQQNVDEALKMFGEWNKVGARSPSKLTDFTRRSFEDGAATVEKLLRAKSLDQTVEIQSDFAKRTFDGYIHELSKVGGIYAQLLKDSYEPIEQALQNSAQRK